MTDTETTAFERRVDYLQFPRKWGMTQYAGLHGQSGDRKSEGSMRKKLYVYRSGNSLGGHVPCWVGSETQMLKFVVRGLVF